MRVLQVGYGNIGKEIFIDYSRALSGDTYMVTDIACDSPYGFEWDSGDVDVAVIVVDTPRVGGRFDYGGLESAVREYLGKADHVVIRSTVSLDFLTCEVVEENLDRISFSPEFYGATKFSKRGMVDISLAIFSERVPVEFMNRVAGDAENVVVARDEEVIVAKLAENAFLASKVTFFHELAAGCERLGLEYENVRRIVAADPRINPAHSICEEYGWQSHCFDKDVPEYAEVVESDVVRAVVEVNRSKLLPLRLNKH